MSFEKKLTFESPLSTNHLSALETYVLVVDDLIINFILVKAVLGKLNMKVIWAENGNKAIEYLKNGHKADVVLMDFHMPGINGEETTVKIKEFLPDLPIVSFSTISENHDFNHSTAPYDAYISKPVDCSHLVITIKNMLNTKISA